MPKKTSFAVIVPCFNEIENIETCVLKLLALNQFDVIALVDDASTDGSANVCKNLAEQFNPGLKAYFLPENRGKNHAVRFAAKKIDTDVIIIYDADLTVEPSNLQTIVHIFNQDLKQFVYGSRFIYDMEEGAMSFINRWGNYFFALWVSRLLRRKITDVLCGVKAIPRRYFLAIPPSNCRWGDFDLMFGAAKQNLEFYEVPFYYKRRQAGHSKMSVFKSGFFFFFKCLRHTYHTWYSKNISRRRRLFVEFSRILRDLSFFILILNIT